MKLNKILIASLLLLAIMAIGAVSASEDIADDTVAAVEPTDEAISQPVDEIEPTEEIASPPADDELESADDSEDVLADDEEFTPEVIWPHDSYFFDNTDRQGVTLTNTFSLEEKFNVGVRAPGANGTFRVYFAGFNTYGKFKFNDTLLASGKIIDGIGITELSIPRNGNPIYTVAYDQIDYWIEYETTKGNGNLTFWTNFIENNINISAQVNPLKLTDGGNNTVTLKFSSPTEGQLQYYLDGIGNYFEHDINTETKSAEIPFEYLGVGTHTIRVFFLYDPTFDGNGKFSKTLTVTVNEWVPTIIPTATKITSSKVTLTYNTYVKKLYFTLTDADGNVLSNQKVSVTFNGKTYKNLVTTKNGKVNIDISSKIVPKTYNAYAKFAGDESYKASSRSVKVVVTKATPKITAAKKTFKVKAKTKKVTATLKNNNGAVLKNVKLTLKIGKKIYTAKTNSKGVATFKVKLTKKGSYTGTVKFAGSTYYKALSKNVAIKVK